MNVLLASHPGVCYPPFAVFLVRLHGYLSALCGEVHLRRVVRPGAEYQVTLLLIKRIIRDVNLAHSLKHPSRLPPDLTTRVDISLEVMVVAVYALRSAIIHTNTRKYTKQTLSCGSRRICPPLCNTYIHT